MLAPWKKGYNQPRQHIKKQRHYFANIVKAMVFPVVICGFESWTIKKAERQKNWSFWTVVLEKILGVPWTARRSRQSILKKISPKCSLGRLMLKLKLQYFGHLMLRTDSLEKILDAGKDWRQEEKGMIEDEMVRWHHRRYGHEFE